MDDFWNITNQSEQYEYATTWHNNSKHVTKIHFLPIKMVIIIYIALMLSAGQNTSGIAK